MNVFTTNVVSLGGVTVGLSILGWNVTTWWAGSKKHNFRDLVPFILCVLYGMLLILSTGGLLGWLSNFALWGSSEIGDAALEYVVGGGSPNATRGAHLILTDGGHAFVIVATVVLIAVWTRKKGFRWDLALSIVCGISLGLSSGVAGAAGFILSPVVSTAGDFIVGLL